MPRSRARPRRDEVELEPRVGCRGRFERRRRRAVRVGRARASVQDEREQRSRCESEQRGPGWSGQPRHLSPRQRDRGPCDRADPPARRARDGRQHRGACRPPRRDECRKQTDDGRGSDSQVCQEVRRHRVRRDGGTEQDDHRCADGLRRDRDRERVGDRCPDHTRPAGRQRLGEEHEAGGREH